MGGYPRRGNEIFGIVRNQNDKIDLTQNGITYTSLLYGNGPGFYNLKAVRTGNLTNSDTEKINYLQETAVPLKQETHGGEGNFLKILN